MLDSLIKESTDTGKSFHGLLAEQLFSVDYEDIMERKDDKGSLYAQSKTRFFAHLYGSKDPALSIFGI